MKRSSRSWRAFCYTGAKNIGIVLFTKFNFLPNLRKKKALLKIQQKSSLSQAEN